MSKSGEIKTTKDGRPTKTLAVVAQLLGAEGFNDHVAHQIEYYHKRRTLTERQCQRLAATRKSLGKIMAKLDEGDRLVIAKFIRLKGHMEFDAGLRIGLMKHVWDVTEGRKDGDDAQ